MFLLICLITALCITEFVHNAVEIWGMRQKVGWLSLGLKGKKHEPWPINIDSKTKTWLLHILILVITCGVSFILLLLLSVSSTTMLVLAAILLGASYLYTTWKVDLFHVEIGELIDQASKPNDL